MTNQQIARELRIELNAGTITAFPLKTADSYKAMENWVKNLGSFAVFCETDYSTAHAILVAIR